MAHIHTGPNQIDMCAEVFVVHSNKVLLRFHDKYKQWVAPGGHIELDETPEQAAIREVKEEVGLAVTLYGNYTTPTPEIRWKSLIPPLFMNIHRVGESEHFHISMIYIGRSDTDVIVQPETHEKTQCRWMTRKEIRKATDMYETIKLYALHALDILGSD